MPLNQPFSLLVALQILELGIHGMSYLEHNHKPLSKCLDLPARIRALQFSRSESTDKMSDLRKSRSFVMYLGVTQPP